MGLVAATAADARDVLVEGASGILAVRNSAAGAVQAEPRQDVAVGIYPVRDA